jgi:hypothetical protein
MVVHVFNNIKAAMKIEKSCEYCNQVFTLRDKNQIGRFCSSLCNRKVLRKEQLKKREQYLLNETEEQKFDWLKRHYEKFVIKEENDCWEWSGSKVNGYANFNHRGKIMKAHRASWIIHHGAIPLSMFVLHKCDVPHCTNPDHLFLGTHTDNMRDMAKKHRTGVRCKLTITQVHEIKNLLTLGVSMVRLAKKYNVSANAIWEIKHGVSWKRAA